MPILIMVVLAVAGFVWWSWGRDRAGRAVAGKMDHLTRKRLPCRWSAMSNVRSGSLQEWRCDMCHVTAYARAPKPPRECKRRLGGGL